jgi:hypothetical protein
LLRNEELADMLTCYGDFVKVAVDIARALVAGGGEYHADCEEVLLADGSSQRDIWGADWYPDSGRVEYNALINIRPSEGNRSIEIQDESIRARVGTIVRRRLAGHD